MTRLLTILFFGVLISCHSNKTTDDVKDSDSFLGVAPAKENMEASINKKLSDYFELYRISPSIVIINNDMDKSVIQLGNHKMEWLDKDDETRIKINKDVIELKEFATVNVVKYGRDSVDFANNWDEIKLYKHNGKEYIGLRMSYYPCTGLGCSVNYYLIYDVATRAKNFFGTFRTGDELELFDFGNDKKVDYVAKTYNGDAHGSTPIEFIYELYSIDSDGLFQEQKSPNGMTYQIKHTTYPNDTTRADELTERWFTNIE